ncbi:alpha/beta hydrolase [Nocardioides sp. WS12]|uniref:alpha/beta fold hydrolase n=1 Tax=Nocardioides sp. WS12 TaxID=2486272 RepID=UPI0015FE5AE3|nr:alpha/beta hydrolase [Nocardioides sp. WS12]
MTAEKPPLVLLHGVTMSARAWDQVIPLLTDRHEVVALTALGHHGGQAADGPVRVSDLVDNAERQLDDLGWDRPHLAGNSLGGWMAVELARRGRASSVCALSPAGFWATGTSGQIHGTKVLRREARITGLTRPVLPALFRSGAVRRFGMRNIAVHGNRLTAEQALAAADDLLGCTVIADILGTPEEIAPMDPLPCPITLAWSEHDAVLPVAVNGQVAQKRLPEARFTVLPGVGHVPMIDNPGLVAEAILESTRVLP